jgi:YidC/Oxa1 family membrane protein insertase
MDFGIGFITNNIMLPILDFFYGIVPSYGLAIVALTLVIRFSLYPLNAGSIRNMRRMKVAQPAMQKRVKEVQERYKDDAAKLQEEMGKVYKDFGNPLAGLFPCPVADADFVCAVCHAAGIAFCRCCLSHQHQHSAPGHD